MRAPPGSPDDRGRLSSGSGDGARDVNRAPRSPWLLLAALVFLAYGSTLRNGFVWDDADVIVGAPLIHRMANLPVLVSRGYFERSNEMSYRPLVTLSYFLDHAVWRDRPFGYHLQNLLWHLLAVLLAGAAALRLTRERRTALLAAALLAVHPVTTEAVNAVGFREDLMAGALMLAGLLAHLRFRGRVGRPAWVWLALAQAAYLAGMLAKEVAIVLPAWLLLAERMPAARAGGLRPPEKRRVLLPWLAYGLTLLFYAALRFLVFAGPRGERLPHLGGSLWSALLTAPRIAATYLRLMVLPLNLSVHYDITPSRGLLDTEVLLALGLILLCLGWAWRHRRTAPAEAWGMAGFFAALLPVANLAPIVNPAAERYLYVPAIPFTLLAAAWLRRHRAPAPAMLALLAVFAGLTMLRNRVWHDEESLWTDAARRHPGAPVVQLQLGMVHQEAGRLPEAVAAYGRMLAAHPGHPAALVNLGVCHELRGDLDAALDHYRRALKGGALYTKVYNNIGSVLAKQGRREEAAAAFREAIRLHPAFLPPRNHLAEHLLAEGQAAAALSEARAALAIDPDDPAANACQARALHLLNRPAETPAAPRRLVMRGAAP